MSDGNVAIRSFTLEDAARLLIAVLLIALTGALLLSQRIVPDVLWALDGAALSFYYSIAIAKTVR